MEIRAYRTELAASRTMEAGKLAQPKSSSRRSTESGRRSRPTSGSLRYLATLLGSTDEATMRACILIVALLLDPAAVLLPLATTHRGRQ